MSKIKFWCIFCVCFLQLTSGFGEQWRLDSRFARLDIIKMIQNNYPSLENRAERISYYSGYYSINPFLLAEEILATNEDSSQVAKRILQLIKENKVKISNNRTTKIRDLMERYDILNANKSSANSAMPAFDLPFNHSQEWYFNGTHTWNGEDDNGDPMSSIDLTRTWQLQWGDETSDDWVVAANDGIITKFSSCSVRITHPSGWATDYYHLDNIQFDTGDTVMAGDKIANYANSLAQATCQGGHSTGPHVHFTLIHNGEFASLSNVALSKWKIHPGEYSYDSSHDRMWLYKADEKKYAYDDTIQHLNGDNEIDYRYNGIYSSQAINGHGLQITVTQIESQDSIRNVIFVAFYTYDDNGDTNFYAGNIDFDNWRIDETKTISMIQTSGGNFSDLMAVDFESGADVVGSMQLHFTKCSEVEVAFSLIEPVTGFTVNKQLNLTKTVGVPDHVCQAPSLLINL